MSVCIERMTQMSSMHPADVREQLADLDAALAVLGELERRRQQAAALGAFGRRPAPRARWPLYFSRAGLGSKVSTCDGPPFMNRKMTRLAFGANIGGLGASGLSAALAAGASRPSPASIVARPEGAETAADLAQRLPAVHRLLR